MTAPPLFEIDGLTKIFRSRRGFPIPRTIVVRAVTLLDYTPGGQDLLGATAVCASSTTCVPVVPGDIGSAAAVPGQAKGTEGLDLAHRVSQLHA